MSTDGKTFFYIINNQISIYKQTVATYTSSAVGSTLSGMSAKSFSVSYDNSIMVILDSSKDLYYLKYNSSSNFY